MCIEKYNEPILLNNISNINTINYSNLNHIHEYELYFGEIEPKIENEKLHITIVSISLIIFYFSLIKIYYFLF